MEPNLNVRLKLNYAYYTTLGMQASQNCKYQLQIEVYQYSIYRHLSTSSTYINFREHKLVIY